jgi:hypothetical protein
LTIDDLKRGIQPRIDADDTDLKEKELQIMMVAVVGGWKTQGLEGVSQIRVIRVNPRLNSSSNRQL